MALHDFHRYAVLFISFVCNCYAVHAERKDSVIVYGKIMDSFTYEILAGVHVDFMRPDSTIIDSITTTKRTANYGGERVNLVRWPDIKLPRKSNVIIKLVKAGYKPRTLTVGIKVGARERMFRIDDLMMTKANTPTTELKEVLVTASRIKMVVHGDTVVYDADAFRLTEGSMLDELIKALPGFHLTMDGRIYVNGEYVSSLLVNGEHFFRGDPRIALENLPAYMVDKVKVYRMETPWSYITKEKKEDLPLIVDVNLKRQYNIGWVGNVDGGYGTSDRYLGKAFALRFTDNSRIAAFANFNNFCDVSEVTTSGNWSGGVGQSISERQSAGIDMLIKDKRDRWKYTGDTKFFRDRPESETLSSIETFLVGSNDVFSRQHSEGLSRNLKVSTNNNLELKSPRSHHTIKLTGTYAHNNSDTERLFAEFNQDPEDVSLGASLDSIYQPVYSQRFADMLVSKWQSSSKNKGDEWDARMDYSSYMKIAGTPDYMYVNAQLTAKGKRRQEYYDYLLQHSPSSNLEDVRQNKYTCSPETEVTGYTNVSYDYRPDWASINFFYKLNGRYRDTERSLYRLDWLENDGALTEMLPSERQAMTQLLDKSNSYRSKLQSWTNSVGFNSYIWLFGGQNSQSIRLGATVSWKADDLTYTRNAHTYTPHRDAWIVSPSIGFGMNNFSLKYTLNNTLPTLQAMLDIVDDADPMNIRLGNKDLHRVTTHEITLHHGFYKRPVALSIVTDLYGRIINNAIAYGVQYDAISGRRVHQPLNINGNWQAGGKVAFTRRLDKEAKSTISSTTSIDYNNSVDHVNERSVVRNLTVRENISSGTILWGTSINGRIGIKYLHATTPMHTFKAINSFDLDYSCSIGRTLPGKISLSADMTVYQRCGYSDRAMNDTRCVVNLHISRAVLWNRVIVKLDAYDVSGSLKRTHKTLNAQGQTEIWNRTIERYALLHIMYKFSTPKKQ